MLLELNIKNFALIENETIRFGKKLNIITGETGAGKSILIGALSLILGKRADSQSLFDAEKKCIIEAHFDIENNSEIQKVLTDNDFETGNTLIIRREILPNGKSRAFVQDTPTQLQMLQEIGSFAVDMHQQFDTLEIKNKKFQLDVLDYLADLKNDVVHFQTGYKTFAKLQKKLQKLQDENLQAKKDQDYNQYIFDEINKLQLQENELEGLEEQINLAESSELLQQVFSEAHYSILENENSIVQQLNQLLKSIKQFSSLSSEIENWQQRISSCKIELEDVSKELFQYQENIMLDNESLQVMKEKFNEGHRLLKKHGLLNSKELIGLQKELELKLEHVFLNQDAEKELQKEIVLLEKSLLKEAKKISVVRNNAGPKIAENIQNLLQKVGMPNAQLKINIQNNILNDNGIDAVQFLFDANKSGNAKEIGQVASGGELSRLMLCIKSLLATKINMPTLIFDEIDSGISGETAKQIGILMKQLASHHQLISITHLAQIAAKANHHWYVSKKENKEQKITSHVVLLNEEERINELAKILSGDKPSEMAIETAKELIQ
ncbi:MAG: DNA repair protein RecN [Chitinophagaceae bacterium]|nr:DNA repair protein RecN [Chitinophagaceae bacterium]